MHNGIILHTFWPQHEPFLSCISEVINLTVDTTRIIVHSYVLNESFTTHSSCATKYFWKLFLKTSIEIVSSRLYASFGTFWVQIGQLVKAQWDFKLSEEIEIDGIFLLKQRFNHFPTFFEDSLCLEWLTNFSKIFFCTWTVDCQRFVQYIHMYLY